MSDTTTAAAVITVSSVRQSPGKNQIEIVATTRQTEKTGKIAPENRVRTILIPGFSVPDVPSKFTVFVVTALEAAARAQLQLLWKENPAIREVPVSAFTIDGILAFSAAQAESRRLTAENIAESFKDFLPAVAEAGRETAKTIMLSMAAPAKVGSIKQLTNLTAKLEGWLAENDEDEERTVLRTVLKKMQQHREKLIEDEKLAQADSF